VQWESIVSETTLVFSREDMVSSESPTSYTQGFRTLKIGDRQGEKRQIGGKTYGYNLSGVSLNQGEKECTGWHGDFSVLEEQDTSEERMELEASLSILHEGGKGWSSPEKRL